MEEKDFYCLGQRDMLASVFMMIRLKGEEKALTELANVYKDTYKDNNPHVSWWLKEQEEKTSK